MIHKLNTHFDGELIEKSITRNNNGFANIHPAVTIVFPVMIDVFGVGESKPAMIKYSGAVSDDMFFECC